MTTPSQPTKARGILHLESSYQIRGVLEGVLSKYYLLLLSFHKPHFNLKKTVSDGMLKRVQHFEDMYDMVSSVSLKVSLSDNAGHKTLVKPRPKLENLLCILLS